MGCPLDRTRSSMMRVRQGTTVHLAEPVRIVMIEDNPGDVYMIRHALDEQSLPYELRVIEDGGSAMSYLRSSGTPAGGPPPNLIVLDLNLPKEDGFEVLRSLRENEAWNRIPVAVLTSSEGPADYHEALRLGANCYLRKPDDLDGLSFVGEILTRFCLRQAAGAAAPE
jgi:chemotaxis family two-component system response regulator Rcp1